VGDETPGSYNVHVIVTSQSNPSVTDEVAITTSVGYAFAISISASKTQTSIGGNLTYEVNLASNQNVADDFTLDVVGIDASWFSMDNSCHLMASETKAISLKISVPDTASSGNHTVVVSASSSKLGTTREASASLSISAGPIIFGLTPANGTHTGATDVLFAWTSSVNSTTKLFIKVQGGADYTLITGNDSISHAVSAGNLTRSTWYDFYVRS